MAAGADNYMNINGIGEKIKSPKFDTKSKSAEQISDLIVAKFTQYAKKVTKNKLRWQEDSYFKNIIESSPLPILITRNMSPVIDYVNPSWEKITGYKLNEVVGKNPSLVRSTKTPSRIHKKIWTELNKGNTYKTELLFDKSKCGVEFQMSSTFFAVKRYDAPLFYAQIAHDITARKIREKYKSMHINIALLLAGAKNIKEAVPQTLKYLCEGIGWELGELWLVNKQDKSLYYQGSWHNPDLDLKKFVTLSKKVVLNPGQGLPGRVWATGKPAWVLNSSKNTYFPNINLALKSGLTTAIAFPILIDKKIIGILTFFTLKARKPDFDLLKTMRSLGNHLGQFIEHKRAVDLLKKLALEQQHILNAAGEGIFEVDKNGCVNFINPAAEKMLGWKTEELIGKRLHEIIHFTKNDRKTPQPFTDCSIYKIIKKRIKKPKVIDNEIFWRKDGSSFPVEFLISPIQDKGKIIGVVGSFIDVTKRFMVDELKKEFLATAAHELKTPVTTLKLLSQHHLNKVKSNVALKPDEFELVNKELNRLIRIIDDVLDDQRVETGKLNLKIETVELNAILENVIRQVRSVAQNHIIVYKKTNTIKAAADADRIDQVITNLITNAIKYSPAGTQISIFTRLLKRSVLVYVKDQGMGIPIDKQAKIFDRFYQIQEHKSKGFGLGLYISKQIIENHNGKIGVKSKEGEGSTFYFSLPLAK